MAAKRAAARKRTRPRPRAAAPARAVPTSPVSPAGNLYVFYCRRRCGFEKRMQLPEGHDAAAFVRQCVGDGCPDCRGALHRRSV